MILRRRGFAAENKSACAMRFQHTLSNALNLHRRFKSTDLGYTVDVAAGAASPDAV